MNTEHTDILTPTIEANLQEEDSRVHFLVRPQAHIHAYVCVFKQRKQRQASENYVLAVNVDTAEWGIFHWTQT